MSDITKTCAVSGQQYVIDQWEQDFYRKMDLPLPRLCPDERQRKRLAWRNERNLYWRECDLCQKKMLSIYSPDKSYKVYCGSCYWGDGWSALDYGRDYDFSRGFFEQFAELWAEVPKLGLVTMGYNVNSDFTHDNYKLQNCYMVFDGEQALDCYFGESFVQVKDCVDFWYLTNSELCYQCVNCDGCYNVKYSRFSNGCRNSAFLLDCKGCQDCVGCVNLYQKRFCIFNQQYSEDEYREKVKELRLDTNSGVLRFRKYFEKFALENPRRFTRGVMNENVTGDNLTQCKDTFESFDCMRTRDCKYCTNVLLDANDCMDIDIWGDRMSRTYNCECVGAGSENLIGCFYVAVGASDVFYSGSCWPNVQNLLGCAGVRQKKFCIFNRQYAEDNYRDLSNKIIQRMRDAGEWGQFFPIKDSCFAYNETVANDYYPMTRDEVLARGYKWKDDLVKADDVAGSDGDVDWPDSIDDVTDDFTKQVLKCEVTGKPFKVIGQELNFYKKMRVPVPRRCFDQRVRDRMVYRNPRKLWDRNCGKCGVGVRSSYAPERPEIVYCDECYRGLVY